MKKNHVPIEALYLIMDSDIGWKVSIQLEVQIPCGTHPHG